MGSSSVLQELETETGKLAAPAAEVSADVSGPVSEFWALAAPERAF
jgi:hypothetical protein